MPTARPFARNTGAAIAGTEQVGNLAVGIPTAGFAATGLPWWNGPDEEPGYVIATQVAANNQPTPPPVYTVGQAALGGIIAYILQPGDPGYDANIQKGLVAATANQSADSLWGCFCVSTGATGTALGTGAANTSAILANCATRPIAASVAAAHNGGGFNDWYLPSKDELNKLYLNRVAIGGFDTGFPTNTYWTSSQNLPCNVWFQSFLDGTTGVGSQNGTFRVRAIRSFTAAPGIANVGFWRSTALTDASFIEIAEYVSRIAGTTQTFATASDAVTWLNTNGYWTSYVPASGIVTSGLITHLDSSNPSSYSGPFGQTKSSTNAPANQLTPMTSGFSGTWYDLVGSRNMTLDINWPVNAPQSMNFGNQNDPPDPQWKSYQPAISYLNENGGVLRFKHLAVDYFNVTPLTPYDVNQVGPFSTTTSNFPVITPNDDISFGLWVNFENYNPTVYGNGYCQFWCTSDNSYGFNIRTYPSAGPKLTLLTCFTIPGGGSLCNYELVQNIEFGMNDTNLNQWNYIFITIKNATIVGDFPADYSVTVPGVAKTYRNGQLITTSNFVSYDGFPNGLPFVVENTFSIKDTSTPYLFEKTNYKIGEFLYYNRLLSGAEVLQNYNATKARFGL